MPPAHLAESPVTTRRRPARRFLLITAAVAVVAVMVWAFIPVASGVISAYSFRGDRAQIAWQAIKPMFGDARGCAACHTTERDRLVTARHTGIGCQSCHGAQAIHEQSPLGGTRTPTSSVCLKCHTQVDGQPATFNSIISKDHYFPTCLSCHDPHTGISNPPPVVSHPTDGLPPCITCHGPDAFKQRSVRHPLTATTDAYCLSCHAAGRGPNQVDVNG